MDSLILIDKKIVQRLNGILGRKKAIDFLVLFFAVYLPFLLCAGVAVFLYGEDKNTFWKNIILLGGLMLFARLVLVEFVRLFVKRKRPFIENSHLKKIFHKRVELSFPSGHAAAFSVLAVTLFPFSLPVGIFVSVCVFLISLARVASGVHYPSDIVAGVIIGSLFGWFLKFLN